MIQSNQRTLVLVELFDNDQSVPPIQISLSGSLTVTRGQVVTAGQIVINASGGSGALTYSAPALSGTGLSLSGNSIVGTVSGAIGTTQVTITVTDALTNSASAVYLLNIKTRLVGLQVTPRDAATQGSLYGAPKPGGGVPTGGYRLSVSGNTGTMTWSVVSGALPTPLVINYTGVAGWINGNTITQAASATPFTGVIRGTDSGTGDTIDVPFSITIYPATYNGALSQPLLPFFEDPSFGQSRYRLIEGTTYIFTINTSGARGGTFDDRYMNSGFQFASDFPSTGSQPSWISIQALSTTQAQLKLTPPVGWAAAHSSFYNASVGFVLQDQIGGLFQLQNSLGGQISSLNFYVVASQSGLTAKQGGVAIGVPNFQYVDFTGVGLGTISSDGTTLTVPISGGVTGVTASSPLSSSGGTAPNITIQQATTLQNGYLSSTDWNTFNNKQSATTYSAVTTSVSVTRGIVYIVNAAALTLTLPASPAVGDTITFQPTLVCTSLTISPNGGKIETQTGNMTCDVFNANGAVIPFALTFANATQGWTVN